MALAFVLVLTAAFAAGGALSTGAAAGVGAPSIASDRPDYAPGDTVILRGDGWGIGEVVHITVNDDAGQTWTRDVNVTADLLGNITDRFSLPDWFVATYTVTATGTVSGTATTTFTDGNVKFDIVPATARAQFVESLYDAATDCTGTFRSGFPKTLNNSAGDNVGVGNNESLRLDASAATTNSPALSFQAWSSIDSPSSPFTVVSATNGLSICIPGFQSGTRNYRATYGNAAPNIASNNASVTASEGSTASNTGTWSDANPTETVTLTASVGTVTKSGNNAGGTWSWSFNTADGPAESQTVTITATDSRGLSTTTTFSLTVNNVTPRVTLVGANSANEGQLKSYSYTVSDPGSETFSRDTQSCGTNGTLSNGAFNPATGAGSFDCSFPDGPNNSSVSVTISDGDGGSDSISVTIANIAPTVTLTGGNSANEGQLNSYSYTVSDPGAETFSRDAHSCGTNGTLSNAAFNPATGAGSFDCSFPDGPNSSSVSVTISDGDGGSDSDSISVTIANVAPTVTLVGAN